MSVYTQKYACKRGKKRVAAGKPCSFFSFIHQILYSPANTREIAGCGRASKGRKNRI